MMIRTAISVDGNHHWRVRLDGGHWLLERLSDDDVAVDIYRATDRLPDDIGGVIAAYAVMDATLAVPKPEADPPASDTAPMRSAYTGEVSRAPVAETEWMLRWEAYHRGEALLAVAQECMHAEALRAGMADEVPTDVDMT